MKIQFSLIIDKNINKINLTTIFLKKNISNLNNILLNIF
jgi:hypothetical protein